MDCKSSVSGPTNPKMIDSCCFQFQPGVCDSPPVQSLPPVDERECQRRCRAHKDCLFYSFSPQACLLQSSCPPQRSPCSGCRSGPKRPPLDKIPEDCQEDTTTTPPTTKGMSTPTMPYAPTSDTTSASGANLTHLVQLLQMVQGCPILVQQCPVLLQLTQL